MKKKKQVVGAFGLQSRILRKLTKLYGKEMKGEIVSPITQSRLSFILHGKRPPTPAQAVMLERVFADLGYAISKFDMVFAFKPDQSILELDKTRQGE
jgi:hypothetical protein